MICKVCIVGLMSCGMAMGQAASAPAASGLAATTKAAPSKTYAFEVVSIRPSKPGSPPAFAKVLPDGYRVPNVSMWSMIMTAYFPQGVAYWTYDRLVGGPPWLQSELYDIDAKVSETDIAEWQKQGPQAPMLLQMLQTMLADRCRFVFHRIPAEVDGWALEVDKRGPKLAEAKAGAVLPAGMKFPEGGVMVINPGGKNQYRYYGVSMEDFALDLSMMSAGHPVQDKTGLTGKYDFVMSWLDLSPNADGREGVYASDNPNPLSYWDLGSLGLKLVPVKVPTETLVIDHIERPSEN
ncbi:MAG: TIGR03435 family protein [Acidobacteriaceae bacterium]